MSKSTIRNISVDDDSLNDLFKEILDGLRDDMQEARDNVESYFDIINANDDAKSLFGTLYHEALKIKGSARDRQLKFLNSFKERVTKKESDLLAKELKGNLKSAGTFDHTKMNKTLEQLASNGDLANLIKTVSDASEEDDEDDE